jgi:hypothetical protein
MSFLSPQPSVAAPAPPPPPPAPPTLASSSVQAAGAAARAAAAAAGGFDKTVKTSPQGAAKPATAEKSLFGS